jgi:hypothetical protein
MTTTASQHIDRDALLSRLTEHDVQAVYEALGVERFGPGGSGHWLVSRPWQATPETHPSVTIRRIDGIWKGHARGEGGSIFDAVMRVQGCDFPAALQFVCEITGIGCSSNGHRKLQHSRRIVETYDYRAEDGRLLFQVVRTDPKDFRQRRPVGNGWEWNVHGVPLVLYRLPELLAAPKRRVFVC